MGQRDKLFGWRETHFERFVENVRHLVLKVLGRSERTSEKKRTSFARIDTDSTRRQALRAF